MLALRATAFALPTPTGGICARVIPTSTAFTPWKNAPFKASFPKQLRPFSRVPQLSNTPNPAKNGNSGIGKNNSNGSGGGGGGGGDYGDGELFASSPELEQLAMRSTDAPILTRVVSYNILSSSLAGASHFPACNPDDLRAATRLKRVMMKLEGPVASRSIICLQEVSLAWSGHLHEFFANRGFHLLLASHGSYFNGYMGEGLAFPLDLYEAVDLRIERLTDMTDWPSPPRKEGLARAVADLRKRVGMAAQALFGSGKKNRFARREPWSHARGRYNRFIFARLRSRTNGAKICVATYHMPCIYWSPAVMMIHAALVSRTFQKLCGEDDGVLAGDFNIKPTDSSYEMIIKGEVDTTHQDFPVATPDGSPAESWFPMPLRPMKSAYREVLGEEPDFTNYAKVENQPVFIETLDYLFCTKGVDVVDVIRLPKRDAVQGPFPDATEPSDHVMIGATIRLPAVSRRTKQLDKAQASKKD